MNSSIEQHDNNFLIYIKNKFKLLVQIDTTVSLLVDEIHLKPCFNYKGGNIVGFYQGLRFHSQRKDGTNPTSIRHT